MVFLQGLSFLEPLYAYYNKLKIILTNYNQSDYYLGIY
jgi:hypothetical protein